MSGVNILERYKEIILPDQSYQEMMELSLDFLRKNTRSNIEESNILTDKLIEEAIKEDDLDSLAELYYLKAWIELDYDKYLKGKEYLEESLALFLKLDKKNGVMRVYSALGYAFAIIGAPQEGFKYYQKALEIATEINALESIGPIYGNMAADFLDLQKYDDALTYYKKSLTYKLTNENIIIALGGLGSIYHILGESIKALGHLQKAYDIAKEEKVGMLQGSILTKLAKIYQDLGKSSKAIDTLKEALSYGQKNKLPRIEIDASLQLGILFKGLDNYSLALEYLLKGLKLAKSVNIRPMELEALNHIWGTLTLSKRWLEAFSYLKEYHYKYLEYHGGETFKAIDRLKIAEALREKEFFKDMRSQLAIISAMGKQLTASLEIKEITAIMHAHLQRYMDISIFGLGLYDDIKGEIEFQYFQGENKWSEALILDLEEDPLFYWCLKNRKEIFIKNYQKEYSDYFAGDPRIISVNDGSQTLACIPLIFSSRIIGLLTIQSPQLEAYNSYQLEMFKALAAYGAIAFENARLYREVKTLAIKDSLTNLFNRRYFLDLAQREFERYKRYGKSFSIIMLDLDYFKKINDLYGHSNGDILLQEIASLLTNQIRRSDLVCRYGGEEFLLLFPSLSLEEAMMKANRLREAIRELTIETNTGQRISITASFGVTIVSTADKEIEDIIKRADTALYKAKDKGRDIVSYCL